MAKDDRAQAGNWREGLEHAGSCPRCGIHVFVDAGGAAAGRLPRPVYLCECRLAEPAAPPPPPWTPALPLMPPSLPSSLPSILPGGGAPWAPMPPGPPPAACPHCYCAEDAGTLGVRHVRCCKCGDRVAAPGHTAWCGSASQASTAQASPDPGPCLSAQSGPAHALAGFAGVLRRCPPEGVTAAGTVSAIAPRR